MSMIRDVIKKADNTPEITEEVKECLKYLLEIAEGKATHMEDEIKLDLQTGKTTDDLTIAITKVIQSTGEYRAKTTEGPNDIIDKIKEPIQAMISNPSASGIVGGIADLLGNGLESLMGIGEGTESSKRIYMVAVDYPAIVRYDFGFWARKISAKGIQQHCDIALACVAYKSAVDVSKLAFNDFLAVYAPILNKGFKGDQSAIKEMIVQAKEVYQMYMNSIETDINEALEIVLSHPILPKPLCTPAVKAKEGNF